MQKTLYATSCTEPFVPVPCKKGKYNLSPVRAPVNHCDTIGTCDHSHALAPLWLLLDRVYACDNPYQTCYCIRGENLLPIINTSTAVSTT